MFRDKIIAAARTGFAAFGAFLVTWVVSLLTSWGFEVTLDPEWATLISGLLFAAFVGLYNLGVAWLTENVWDGFGWLLGVNKPPSYVDADLRTEPSEDPGLALDSNAIQVDSGLPTVEGGEDYRTFLESGETDPHRS